MRFIRRHWYVIGLFFTIGSVAFAIFGRLALVQVILLVNFAVLTLHQFEEYAWPGGEPWIINEFMQPKGGPADRYPLNQNNAFFMNVPLAWTFYLVPVFFPSAVWLGLAPTIFGFGQLVGHGIMNNIKLKSLYNPGLAAVVFGHVPVGIWYLTVVYSANLITPWDWLYAFALLACFVGVGMLTIGYTLLTDRNSPYPFAPEEMERFDPRGHLARVGKPQASR